MIRPTAIVLAVALTAGSALAQAPAPAAGAAPAPGAAPRPPPIPRARGPQLALAVEMAQEAVAVCKANGYNTTALVADSAGVPVAMLSGDGAAARTQEIAASKVAMVVKYKEASGVTTTRAQTDTALMAELRADPKILQPRAGAFPIMVGNDMIGAIAVSGAPGGQLDEACATPAIAKVQARLR